MLYKRSGGLIIIYSLAMIEMKLKNTYEETE